VPLALVGDIFIVSIIQDARSMLECVKGKAGSDIGHVRIWKFPTPVANHAVHQQIERYTVPSVRCLQMWCLELTCVPSLEISHGFNMDRRIDST